MSKSELNRQGKHLRAFVGGLSPAESIVLAAAPTSIQVISIALRYGWRDEDAESAVRRKHPLSDEAQPAYERHLDQLAISADRWLNEHLAPEGAVVGELSDGSYGIRTTIRRPREISW